jgi:hypothetical protein
MAFKSRFSHAAPGFEYAGSVRFPAVRYRAAGASAVLILLKVIFSESSTRSGLAGRFLDRG